MTWQPKGAGHLPQRSSVRNAREALDIFLRPASVALVGASTNAASLSGMLVKRLTESRFAGTFYPINPRAAEIAGCRSFASLAELPERPDLALIMRGSDQTLEELRTAVEAGVPAVALYNALEEEYAAFNEQVQAIIAGSATRVLGPNSAGYENYVEGTSFTYAAPPGNPQLRHGLGIAIIGHSGGIVQSTAAQIMAMGASVSHMISLGNEADLKAVDFVDYFVADRDVKVVVAYLEQIRDPQRFLAATEDLSNAGKHLVILRVGRSKRAQGLAMSHTGAIVGSLEHEAIFLRRAGVHFANSVREASVLASALRAADRQSAARKRGLGIVTLSGGLSGVLADLAETHDVQLPDLALRTAEELRASLSGQGLVDPNVVNPLDLGVPGMVDAELWHRSTDLVLGQEDVGAALMLVQAFLADRNEQTIAIARRLGKPIGFLDFMKNSAAFLDASAEGFPVFIHEDEAMLGMGAILEAAAWVKPEKLSPTLDEPASRPASTSEHALKAWLRGQSVAVPTGVLITEEAEIPQALTALSFPVVLKASVDGLVHKSDVGGVRANICTRQDLVDAMGAMRIALATAGYNEARFLVEEQARFGGTEWFVGVKNDFAFGPVILFGMGGLAVEAIKQVASAPAPLSMGQANVLLSSVPVWSLLRRRGQIGDDAASSMVQLLRSVSEIAWRAREWLADLDLNPVVLSTDGRAIALDAAIGNPPNFD